MLCSDCKTWRRRGGGGHGSGHQRGFESRSPHTSTRLCLLPSLRCSPLVPPNCTPSTSRFQSARRKASSQALTDCPVLALWSNLCACRCCSRSCQPAAVPISLHSMGVLAVIGCKQASRGERSLRCLPIFFPSLLPVSVCLCLFIDFLLLPLFLLFFG